MIRHCEAKGRGNPARRVFGAGYRLPSGLPRRLRLLAMTSVLLLLTGCLLVKNFDTAWNEAKTDSCLNKIGESLYVSEFRRDPTGKDLSQLVRGWVLDDQKFLLLKKDAADNGGRIYRFNVVHGIFQRYRLNPAMRETFKKNYPNSGIILNEDTVTIEKLDDKSRKLLGEIASNPDYWEMEDQTLYNPIRNPACLFEDRKGKELKE